MAQKSGPSGAFLRRFHVAAKVARNLATECLAAIGNGVDLHGTCLFPAVDMTDWHTGGWLQMRIADVERLLNGVLMRTPNDRTTGWISNAAEGPRDLAAESTQPV